MKTLFSFFFSLTLCSNINAQNWNWAMKATGNSQSIGNVICRDNQDNLFVHGIYDKNISFGAYTLAESGSFLAKYNSSGVLLWAKNIPFEAKEMRCDNHGNLYIAGFYYNTTLSTFTGTYTSVGSYDIFLVKCDPSGTELWSRSYGGSDYDIFSDMTVDIFGNVFITGVHANVTDTMKCGNLNFVDTSAFRYFYLAKIDPSGSTAWVTSGLQNSDTSCYDSGWALKVDANQNILVLGFGMKGNQMPNTRYFWARFDQGGNLISHQWLGLSYGNSILSFDRDENGNLYTITENTYTNNPFGLGTLKCFDSNWNPKWSFYLGGPHECYFLRDINTDKYGNVYLRGYNIDTVSANCIDSLNRAEVLNQRIPWAGQYDIIVTKINNTGHLDWIANAGGPSVDYAIDMCVSRDGDVYLTGQYNRFDPYRYNFNGDAYTVGTANFGSYSLNSDGQFGQYYIAKLGHSSTVDVKKLNMFAEDIIIYPNPAQEELHIDAPGNMNLKITDVLGRCVCTRQLTAGTNSLNISDQPDGVYVVELSNGSFSTKSKIVIRQ
jgi:hypothetical protein